jgi:hypothetical protein
MLLLACMGTQPSAGYTVRVGRILEEPPGRTAVVTFQSPGPTCGRASTPWVARRFRPPGSPAKSANSVVAFARMGLESLPVEGVQLCPGARAALDPARVLPHVRYLNPTYRAYPEAAVVSGMPG